MIVRTMIVRTMIVRTMIVRHYFTCFTQFLSISTPLLLLTRSVRYLFLRHAPGPLCRWGIPVDLTRFNEICHPSQRPRWQVDKEAIGLSRVHQCSSTYNPPS